MGWPFGPLDLAISLHLRQSGGTTPPASVRISSPPVRRYNASCISPNSLAPALSVPESASASFPRSLGNPACEAELIKTRSLESDSGASRRWPEPGGQSCDRDH